MNRNDNIMKEKIGELGESLKSGALLQGIMLEFKWKISEMITF